MLPTSTSRTPPLAHVGEGVAFPVGDTVAIVAHLGDRKVLVAIPNPTFAPFGGGKTKGAGPLSFYVFDVDATCLRWDNAELPTDALGLVAAPAAAAAAQSLCGTCVNENASAEDTAAAILRFAVDLDDAVAWGAADRMFRQAHHDLTRRLAPCPRCGGGAA